MRYMLLIGGDKAAPPPQKAEMEAMMQGHQRFAEELQAIQPGSRPATPAASARS